MTRTVKSILAATTLAAIAICGSQIHAATPHSLAALASKLQNSQATHRSKSFPALMAKPSMASKISLLSNTPAKHSDLQAIHTETGFTKPSVRNRTLARKFQSLASQLSQNGEVPTHKHGDKNLLTSNVSDLTVLKSQMSASPVLEKTQPAL